MAAAAFPIKEALAAAGAMMSPDGHVSVTSFRYGDRRGWVWVGDAGGDQVAHLSLLVADGRTETDTVRTALEQLPPPVGCEIQQSEEAGDEFVRAVTRFPISLGGNELRTQLHQLTGTADLITGYAVECELVTGHEALLDLWAVLGDAGVAAPPVPVACRGRLTVLGSWWWGSALVHPFEMYMFNTPAALLGDWNRGPLFAMSHAGHGVNSYGLSVAVAAGPVAAFVQHHFGGGYGDPLKDRESIAATYARLHRVLGRAESDTHLAAKWLLLMSDYRDVYELIGSRRRSLAQTIRPIGSGRHASKVSRSSGGRSSIACHMTLTSP